MARFGESLRLGLGETFSLFAQTLRYAAPFKARFAAKYALLLLSLAPLLVLPWPVKIIVDHVIEAIPIGAQTLPYPPLVAWLLKPLEGATPARILAAMLLFQLAGVVLVGAVGTGGNERDQAEGWLASGQDAASQTENEANAGFSMASGLLGFLDFRLTIRLTQALNHHYRSRLFARLQRLPMTTFDDERIGDAVFRVLYDTPAITNAVYRIVLTPIASGLFAAAIVWVIASLFGDHPLLWQSGLAILVIAFATSLPFAGAVRRRSGASRRAGATTTSSLEEGLSNILAVQSLGAEGREQARFDRDSWESFSRHRSLLRLGMLIFLCGLVPALWILARVLFYTSDLVITGQISRGDFTLLFSYFVMLAFACVELGALWIRLQESAAGLQRVGFLMDLPIEVDAPEAQPLARVREGIRFEGIHYAHPDGTRALEDVTLEARRGEVVALVGPAGAGKTTLVSLVPRFLRPQRGVLRFDGVDVSRATLESVRRQVAFVFQETVLFDATVAENLAIGEPAASRADLERAARLAGAHEFVAALPQGYDTPLGRGGGRLSVGQRQRLAIARALVRDAPILVLDEPTSALDPETEQGLVATLREARRERVVLVIAHRLSTVREADRIAFVDGGRILESGTHRELMARPGGAYRRFVELQTLGVD